MGKAQELTGWVLCQFPQEADSEIEFGIQKMYYGVTEINPCGGVREVGLGKGGCWAAV